MEQIADKSAPTRRSDKLKQIILNTKEPLLMKMQMKTNCLLSWSLDDWQQMIGNELLTFRCGKNVHTQEPQWEGTCTKKQATFQDFLHHCYENENNSSLSEWWYFDYKYLHNCSDKIKSIFKDFNWADLGFPELQSTDSTIWIGSKNAHTSCHKDTYGCNIILQVYGRKHWLLFPPEENLQPTRVPYEESSVYSKLNFFSTNKIDFKGVSHCYEVTLEPGDVLVLPHKWWHYVENLEAAISVNAWLPLPDDYLEQIKESITAIFIGQIMKSQKDDYKQSVLNPNMVNEMVQVDEALDILQHLISKHKSLPTEQQQNKRQCTTLRKISSENQPINVEDMIREYDFISQIPKLTQENFKQLIANRSKRFPVTTNTAAGTMPDNDNYEKLTSFLDSVTNEEVISLIADKLINKM